MRDRYLEMEGRKVHYTVDKAEAPTSAKPVVLLHGFTEAVFVWDELAAFLCGEGYDVICPDLAGHGQTESFGNVHSMELQARLTERVMEEENIEQAVIIGHSMGGYVAAAFACLFPQKVKGVGFFHSHPGGDTETAKENRRRALALLQAGKMSFVTETTGDLFAPGTASRYSRQIEALNTSAKAMGASAIAAAQQGMLERPSLLQVYDLPVPFMFIIGKRDGRADPAKIMAQTLLPEEAHVLLLPVGHMGFYESKEQTQAFINGYLRAVCW